MLPVALTIAGSDSSGGAGVQADLKTFAAFGVYGASVITALTAQNSRGVRAIAEVAPIVVANQMAAVTDDLPVAAIKTGMLSRAPIIEIVVDRLRSLNLPLVVDPVMVAAGGDVLLEPSAISSLRDHLVPLATIITPNLAEAEMLTGRVIKGGDALREAARALIGMGAKAVLLKGGRLFGDAVDLFYDGKQMRELRSPRVGIGRSQGAGCTLSAGITACLAFGEPLEEAVAAAKSFVTRAIESAPQLGAGARALNHLASPEARKSRRKR